MGRRPTVVDVPACPRTGHAGSKVVLAGTYGDPPRQLFRCSGPSGVHRFAGTLPRMVSETGVCQHCDNPVHRHQGPLLTRDYEFHLRLAAKALIDVGSGVTYTEAAARARMAAGRGEYRGREPNGSLVAEWVDVLAPVLIDAHAETAWPETVLADSTTFFVTNNWTGVTSQAFAVVGTYGYEAGRHRGRLLGLYAAHQDVGHTYVDAFDDIEAAGRRRTGKAGEWAPPAMVLTDGAREVIAGVRSYWRAGIGPGCGPGTGRPYSKRCEWHLRHNALDALGHHGIGGYKHWMRLRLDTAFLRDEGWQEFVDAGARLPRIARWAKANDRQVRDQASRRAQLPQHHSIAAVEHVLTRVRARIERRSFTFRNQRRMNLLLGLMRLAELRVDDLDHYTELLREAARAAGGRIIYQRQGYCTGAAYDLRP